MAGFFDDDDDEVFLTTDETMTILGLSRQSISRLRSTGELTTYIGEFGMTVIGSFSLLSLLMTFSNCSAHA